MKKLIIFAIIGTTMIFQSCGPKEKQVKTETLNDSIVTETVVIDSVTTESGTEIIEEKIETETVKTTTENPTTVTKITVKDTVKIVTPTKTVAIVDETKKTEVVTKVVDVEEPKKVIVAETPVKVTVEVPTSTAGWVVPSKYISMKNPTDKTDSENMAIGKSLYSKHCKACHGAEGYGDGTKARDLDGDLGDFSSKETQNQTDGALFYKISTGRDDMPNFTKKLHSDEDRWLIVNYMRTL